MGRYPFYITILCAVAIISSTVLFETAAVADEVHVTGNTTANEQLIHDTLGQILTLSKGILHCSSLESVETIQLPPDMVPPALSKVALGAKISPEGWTATLCGQKQMFLVGFWPGPTGSTMFAATYLGPADQSQPK